MEYRVYKFGGASLKDAQNIENVAKICSHNKGVSTVLVASATAKSTNELEVVLAAHRSGNESASQLFNTFKARHYQMVESLLGKEHPVIDKLNDLFVEAEWVLEEEHPDYNYEYDQLVCVGELVSSTILNAVLQSKGLNTTWLDAREVVLTDNIFREASVLWDKTEAKIKHFMHALSSDVDYVVTQGFIGSTTENETTTLGREGSDYSAAIFSYCLNAVEMSIWKDVPGILNADPNLFDQVTKIDRLSYREAVEMTYYGAKVIHPKTIKPLENKRIPLWVKSFIEPEGYGTLISEYGLEMYPPVIVIERKQALVRISPKDFSFIAEHHLSELFSLFNELRIKVNMMQNTAISFTVCVNHELEKVNELKCKIEEKYNLLTDEGLELITIRHYTEESVKEHKRDKMVLFEERLKDTVQLVAKPAVRPVRKTNI